MSSANLDKEGTKVDLKLISVCYLTLSLTYTLEEENKLVYVVTVWMIYLRDMILVEVTWVEEIFPEKNGELYEDRGTGHNVIMTPFQTMRSNRTSPKETMNKVNPMNP